MDLKTTAKNMPLSSGVYLMKDSNDKIIYVGKAKNLRNRVSSYFLKNQGVKTHALVSHIASIDCIVTKTEYEALLLENNLIKKYMPKYNILLKDGKSYPLIRITNEKYPVVIKTRKKILDGSIYYGPFPDSKIVDSALKFIYDNFKVRRSSSPLKKKKSPCLYYHINKCYGPCFQDVDEKEYKSMIDNIKSILENKTDKFKNSLLKEMKTYSLNQEYEKAASIRDTLKSLNSLAITQNVEDPNNQNSNDYIALALSYGVCSISIMQIRDGKLMGNAIYRQKTLANVSDILTQFIIAYYQDEKFLPAKIFVDEKDVVNLLQTFFEKELKNKVIISEALEKKDYQMLRMAEENAQKDVNKRIKESDKTKAIIRLKEVLNLEKEPRIIEGFDIAQLHGKHTVASLINFKDGVPNKKEYRIFKIKSLDGKVDDYKAISEAVTRRYTRLLKENKTLPDLLLIDGGKGQVNSARKALDSIGLESLYVIGLAKQYELVYQQDQDLPLELEENDSALKVLIAIRDECHRFATTFNQNRRTESATKSILESINGVGKVLSKRLLIEFASIENIKNASIEELKTKGKISENLAKTIKDSL